jgi:type I restriction enzyme S subunit
MKKKTAVKSKKLEPIKKHGNKHPNLGLIPNGWEVHRFADVFEFLPTNSFSRDQMTYGGNKDSIYNIHYGDIHATFNEQILDFNKHIHQIPVLLDTTEVRPNDNAFLKDGDLIIADASEDYDGVGECIEITGINKRKVLGGLHTITARDLIGKTVQGFRAYLLKNQRVFINLKKLATGSKVYGVSKGNVAELELVVPPIHEQQKIARILSTWDKAIEKTELLIAQKQQYKIGLMQQLLTGKLRFKEFVKSKKMKKTKLGMIPQDWTISKVKDFARVMAGATPSTGIDEYWDGDIRWMNSGELNLKVVYEVEGRITEAGLKNSSTKPVPINSILIGLAGQGKTRGTVAINKVELCTNQSIAAVIPELSKVFYDYLYLNLDSRYDELRKLSTGEGGRGGLNLEIIKNVNVSLPSTNEQAKIARVILSISKAIEKLSESKKELVNQKKGLMQKLLTGQIRVKI